MFCGFWRVLGQPVTIIHLFQVNSCEINSSLSNKILTQSLLSISIQKFFVSKQLLYWSSKIIAVRLDSNLHYSSTNKIFSVVWFKNSQCGDKIEKELLCIDFHFKCDKDFTVVFLGRLWSSEILSCLNKRENNTSFRTSISVKIL